jgi:FkbM family methyltransferase
MNLMKIYSIPPVKKTYDYLIQKVKRGNIIVNRQGSKMLLDRKDTLNLSIRKVWEPLMTKIFNLSLSENMNAVDIGSHIGYYTLMASKKVGNGKVFSIEAETNNYKTLLKNIEMNGYKNIIPINVAAGDKNKTVKFYRDEIDLGKHSIYRKTKNSIDVKMIDIKEIMPEKVDVIKMDVQGAEVKILPRLDKAIKENRNLILFTELDPESLTNANSSYEEYLTMLMKRFNSIYIIDEIEKSLVRVTSIPNKIYGAGVNLICWNTYTTVYKSI